MRRDILILHIFRLTFGLVVLGGTAWLIMEHEWSEWWFVFSLLLCNGYSPSSHTDSSEG